MNPAAVQTIGAATVIDPEAPGAIKRVLAATGGRGARVIVDAVGTLLDTAITVAAKGHRSSSSGWTRAKQVEFDPVDGVTVTSGTCPVALDTLAAHQDLFRPIISDRLPITQWPKVERLFLNSESAGKILVRMTDVCTSQPWSVA